MSDDTHRKLRADLNLGNVVDEYDPLSFGPADGPFERLVVLIINQQPSTTAMAMIYDRPPNRAEVIPEGMFAVGEDVLHDCGLSNQKVGYAYNAVDAFRDSLSAESLREMDGGEVASAFTEICGVGDWTAKMLLIFALTRENIPPVGDLRVRRGMEHVFGFEQDVVSRGEMHERAERWTPYQSCASRYLWQCVD